MAVWVFVQYIGFIKSKAEKEEKQTTIPPLYDLFLAGQTCNPAARKEFCKTVIFKSKNSFLSTMDRVEVEGLMLKNFPGWTVKVICF